jgi:hypothetical protein
MADADLTIDSEPVPPGPPPFSGIPAGPEALHERPVWPLDPEGLLGLLPKAISGDPINVIEAALARAEGMAAVLKLALFASIDLTNTEASDALEGVQGQISLARALLRRVEVAQG